MIGIEKIMLIENVDNVDKNSPWVVAKWQQCAKRKASDEKDEGNDNAVDKRYDQNSWYELNMQNSMMH